MDINVGAVIALAMIECFVAQIAWIAHNAIENDTARGIVLAVMSAIAGAVLGAGFGIWLVTV